MINGTTLRAGAMSFDLNGSDSSVHLSPAGKVGA